MPELPLAPLDRLIRKATGLRVSESATIELGKLLEEEAQEIAKQSATFSQYAKRKTITSEDILLANKQRKNK